MVATPELLTSFWIVLMLILIGYTIYTVKNTLALVSSYAKILVLVGASSFISLFTTSIVFIIYLLKETL